MWCGAIASMRACHWEAIAPGQADHHGIGKAAQPLHVEDDDALQRRHLLAHLQHLVELLFVLDEDDARAAVAEHVGYLLGRVGGVDANRDAARGDDGEVGVEPLGAVLGQDAGPVRRRDALLDERQRNLPDLRAVFAPADGAPQAPLLAAHRDALAAQPHRLDKGRRHCRRRRRHDLLPGAEARPVRVACVVLDQRHSFFLFQRCAPRAPCSFTPR